MKSFTATGLVAASMLAIPAPSAADVRIGVGIHIDNGYRRERYYQDTYGVGYDRGYEDGYREGGKDGRRHERYSFWDEGRYRDGDSGYKGRYGPRWEYRNGYRRGFEAGYRQGYEAYSYGYRDYRGGGWSYRHRHPGRGDWCYERH